MEQHQINCEGSFGGSSSVICKCLEGHSLLLVLEHCHFLFHQMVPLLFPHICLSRTRDFVFVGHRVSEGEQETADSTLPSADFQAAGGGDGRP